MDHNTTVADVAHKANDFEAYAESSYVYIWPLTRASDLATARMPVVPFSSDSSIYFPKRIIRSKQWANGTIDKDGYVTNIKISMTARRLRCAADTSACSLML